MTARIKYLDAAEEEWFDADKQPVWLRQLVVRAKCGELWERVAEGKRRD